MCIALKVEPGLHFLWIGPLPGCFAPPFETDLQCFSSFLPPKEEAGTQGVSNGLWFGFGFHTWDNKHIDIPKPLFGRAWL